MATFKALVYKHHRKADGTYNVKIRVTHKQVKRNLATNVMVDDGDVTRSMKIKNQKIVDILDDMIRKCRQRCNEHAMEMGDMDVDGVVRLVADVVAGKKATSDDHFDFDFIAYSREYILKLRKDGRNGTADTRAVAINNLVKFIGRDYLSVHEITSKFILNWVDFIRDRHARRGKQKGTVESAYPSSVKAILNVAKEEFNDEELGIIRLPQSPFKKVKLPEPPQRKRRALEVEVVRMIFAYEGEMSKTAAFAREMFMLSFLLVGINEADLFSCTDYSNGRIAYNRVKVENRRKDKGNISIKVEPEVADLLKKYRDLTGKQVFKFYQMYSSVNSFTSVINGIKRKVKDEKRVGGLKELGRLVGVPDLIFYSARHSWATIARNKCGVSKDDVALALNHKDANMGVTDTYLERDWSLIDNANRKVIDYVLHGKE
jgi:integrase